MANPQKEDGYTPIANKLLEKIYSSGFSGTQHDILLCIFRYTYGFKRKTHSLSVTFISDAIEKHRTRISPEINKLIKANIIVVEKNSTYTRSRKIGINKNYDDWALSKTLTVNENATVTKTSTLTGSETINTTVDETATVTVDETATQERKKEKLKKESSDDFFLKEKSPLTPTEKNKQLLKELGLNEDD